MNPGDMIEWIYTYNKKCVVKNEHLYSSTMSDWTTIDEPALLISITDETYMWLNSKGLFHARVDDMTKRYRFTNLPSAETKYFTVISLSLRNATNF